MPRPSGSARPRRPRTPKAKCCRLFRPSDVTDAQIEEAVAALRGEIDQVPSAVSAIKVGGKRAYKLAREGQTVELAPRSVRIDRFDVLAIRRHDGLVDVDVEVDCSSGTYIRALARDVGAALGSVAISPRCGAPGSAGSGSIRPARSTSSPSSRG